VHFRMDNLRHLPSNFLSSSDKMILIQLDFHNCIHSFSFFFCIELYLAADTIYQFNYRYYELLTGTA